MFDLDNKKALFLRVIYAKISKMRKKTGPSY